MIDVVAPQDFIITFATSALIVLLGAGYAAFFAWSRVTGWHGFSLVAGGCYVALVYAVLLLSHVAHLDGHWRILSALMLAGYLAAPYGIWRLCAASHPHESSPDRAEG